MEKNKTGKYFKYALGEIVLVMIGILLALQINNWNEKRKENSQTIGLLENMIKDLKTDIQILDLEINNFNQHINSSRTLLISEDYQLFSSDSIYNLLPTNSTRYKLVDLTYEKLKNVGVTKILDSDELLNSITTYYTTISNYLEMGVSWDFEYALKATDYWRLGERFEAPILNDTLSMPFLENESERKTTFIKELSSIKSRNQIRYAISRKLAVLDIFKVVKSRAEGLVESIEQELVKTK
ncbi:hypothetical protein SAMN04515667_1233 [Formosa sp. Hel1_31_208]|uniref:DUF6090 family protein n=1 Tax=Formosa sp. Hel1_31_208 TaxID=1798225 RepID=UPI00087AE930|nr:DUF6090 family protein [Formosa sp. Hel1_31_208]SDS02400.1 hypothetical protein SAMN04515667_1233 [Formosa sp. Hel1_31_208]